MTVRTSVLLEVFSVIAKKMDRNGLKRANSLGCAFHFESEFISKIPHRNSKIIFAVGSYEYLERLEGKIRKCLFFHV